MVGAYGLAAVCADEPDVIAVARKDSPIVVGRGERGSYVASDVIALIDATRDVVVLEDGQFARLSPEGITYTDAQGRAIEPAGHARRLGCRYGREGRLPGFHDEGDPRAAPRGSRHVGGASGFLGRARHR